MKAKFKQQITGVDDPDYQMSKDEWNSDDVIELIELITNEDIDASAAISESKIALNFSTHSNLNDPSGDQKYAMEGANFPSLSNPFATLEDIPNSGDINHDDTFGYVANEHIDWTNAAQNLLTTGNITGKDLLASGGLGAEKVTNGTFTGSATGWTLGTGWAYVSGKARKNADGIGTLSQASGSMVTPPVIGETYRIYAYISNSNGEPFTISCGGKSFTITLDYYAFWSEVFTATTTDGIVVTPGATASRFDLDDISLKKVEGKIQGSYADLNSQVRLHTYNESLRISGIDPQFGEYLHNDLIIQLGDPMEMWSPNSQQMVMEFMLQFKWAEIRKGITVDFDGMNSILAEDNIELSDPHSVIMLGGGSGELIYSNRGNDENEPNLWGITFATNYNNQMYIMNDGGIVFRHIKSGATQAAAGGVVGELWRTQGHATLPNGVLMIGI